MHRYSVIDREMQDSSPRLTTRLVVAIAFAAAHLALFTLAGHVRTGVPFYDHSDSPAYAHLDAVMTSGYPREPQHWSRLVVSRWDAQNYIGTAVRGLAACPTSARARDIDFLECGLGWLPAYGEAGRLVTHTTGLAEDVSLLAISILAAIAINFMWLSRTIVDRLGAWQAGAALVAFNLFPTAFYVVTPYPEAATIALCLGGFLALSRERWVLAGLLIGAATALRIQAGAFGLALAAAALVAAHARRRGGDNRWWWPLLAVPLAGWGQCVEMLALRIYTGDAFAFWRARVAFGDTNRVWRLWHPNYYLKAFSAQHMDGVILGGALVVIFLTARRVLREFRREEAVFLAIASFATVPIAIMAPMGYWGMSRYLLLCPLLFLGGAALLRRQAVLGILWFALCAMFYWKIELCSYISQGSKNACPQLGRLECALPWGS
ncbi:MAG: putative rane protein [Myxococcales bacterium]|nr:putative rane protein [Myxococcales bacterium]